MTNPKTTGDPANEKAGDEFEWLTLSPRQMELMLWQLLDDMGGEISTIPPEDTSGKTVMFYRDRGEYIGMISNECEDD